MEMCIIVTIMDSWVLTANGDVYYSDHYGQLGSDS